MKQLHSPHNKGFTLLEMLIVVAIVGGLTIVVSKFMSDVFVYNKIFDASFSTLDDAQKLLRPMTQEIRSASTSSSGAYPIDSIGDYSFSFYSDIDNDGLKDWVRYSLSGTSFIKETIKPTGNPLIYNQANKITRTFLTGIRNQTSNIPIFTYYSSTYTGGSTGIIASSGQLESVRMVGLLLRLDSDPTRSPVPVDISTKVAIRNLKQQQ